MKLHLSSSLPPVPCTRIGPRLTMCMRWWRWRHGGRDSTRPGALCVSPSFHWWLSYCETLNSNERFDKVEKGFQKWPGVLRKRVATTKSLASVPLQLNSEDIRDDSWSGSGRIQCRPEVRPWERLCSVSVLELTSHTVSVMISVCSPRHRPVDGFHVNCQEDLCQVRFLFLPTLRVCL